MIEAALAHGARASDRPWRAASRWRTGKRCQFSRAGSWRFPVFRFFDIFAQIKNFSGRKIGYWSLGDRRAELLQRLRVKKSQKRLSRNGFCNTMSCYEGILVPLAEACQSLTYNGLIAKPTL